MIRTSFSCMSLQREITISNWAIEFHYQQRRLSFQTIQASVGYWIIHLFGSDIEFSFLFEKSHPMFTYILGQHQMRQKIVFICRRAIEMGTMGRRKRNVRAKLKLSKNSPKLPLQEYLQSCWVDLKKIKEEFAKSIAREVAENQNKLGLKIADLK